MSAKCEPSPASAHVVKSATNQETVRFDLAAEEQEPGLEFASHVLQDTGADLLELDFLAPGAKAFRALQSADCWPAPNERDDGSLALCRMLWDRSRTG